MNASRLAVVIVAVVAVVIGGVVMANRSMPPAPVDRPRIASLPPGSDGEPDPVWVAATSKSTQIGKRVVTAYARAAMRIEKDNPDCRLAWNTLAGIANTESNHGYFGGSMIDKDGGELDGDTTWDRAVGPFQFIPSTWKRWAVDADGDGVKNPHSIEDAALAAGRYLCHSGGDLGQSRGWSEAVLAYNHSVAYATEVARTATKYAEATQLRSAKIGLPGRP